MNLSLHLLAGILKKAVIVFGAVLIVTGFLFFSERMPTERSVRVVPANIWNGHSALLRN